MVKSHIEPITLAGPTPLDLKHTKDLEDVSSSCCFAYQRRRLVFLVFLHFIFLIILLFTKNNNKHTALESRGFIRISS